MPGFDRSGPEGQGPVTGKMRGMCQRTDYSAFTNVDRGRGRGRGIGQYAMAQGTGRGRMQSQSPVVERFTKESELVSLKKQYDTARQMMEELQEKIAAMETREK
ncbi:MAG: DUF5320 domain-containing protein [Desulfobulbaceae bacterium]|nr:DUF5320 domain-containing protein [Desulfobulbaceae bacterium]